MQVQTVKFTKKDTVNGIEYAEGDTLSVSPSIFEKLNENGSVEVVVAEEKPTKKAKEA